jgi:hypothetical protein
MYDVTLPVPVLFASPEVQTKAPITAIQRGMKIGVFGFKSVADRYSDEDDGMNMRNAYVYVNTGLTMKFNDPFYYPESKGDDNFRFYSYLPYSDSYEIDGDGKVSVELEVATDKDILWDREDGEGGFNADLAREGVKPRFSYTHPAACISFYAEVDKVSTKTVVGQLILKNVPKKAKLCVADINNPEDEGRFYEVTQVGDTLVTNGSNNNLNIKLSTEPTKLGKEMFIYPDSRPFRVQVKLLLGETGKESKIVADYVIRPEDLPDGRFLPGHHYNFSLNVLTASSDISFKVTKDSEEDILDFDNEFQWEDAF